MSKLIQTMTLQSRTQSSYSTRGRFLLRVMKIYVDSRTKKKGPIIGIHGSTAQQYQLLINMRIFSNVYD
jgi:hypothetical protein